MSAQIISLAAWREARLPRQADTESQPLLLPVLLPSWPFGYFWPILTFIRLSPQDLAAQAPRPG
jgi:hypothetical protein